MKTILLALIFAWASSGHAKEFKIAALFWSMNIEGQVAMRKGVEAEVLRINALAKKNKEPHTIKLIPYVAGDGEKGIQNQVIQFEKIVSQRGVDLILIQPTDNAALSNGLKMANKANIPVVAYDQYIIGGKITSYLTSNNYQAGALDGEYIASLFDDEYEIKLILVEYPHVSSTVERVDGFIDALKKAKQKFRIVKTYRAVEPVSGRRAGLDILRDFPQKGSVDAVFTINDGGGLPVVDELAKAGRSEIVVATIDGDPRSVANIKAKKLTVIDSAQFCGELGRQSLITSYRFLKGETVAPKILIPTFPITLSTLARYPGWGGSIPKAFEKPWGKGDYWNNQILEFEK